MNMPDQPNAMPPQQSQQPPQMRPQQGGQPAAPGVIKTAAQPWGGFWKRFVAAMIDGIVLSMVTTPLYLVFLGSVMTGVQGLEAGGQPDPEMLSNMMTGMVLYMVACFVIYFGYFAGMESSKFQGTFGKMALGMAVVDVHGRRIGFGTACVRLVVKMFLSGILLIGYIMAAFDDKKRSLHDRLASTYVVNKAK